MRYVLALLLLLVSSIGSAQVFKCTRAGQVAYQDTPCAQGDQTQQMHVGADPLNDLVGCFDAMLEGSNGRTGFMLRVRMKSDGYELRALGSSPYSSVFTLRRAGVHELDAVNEASHLHLRAGLTVKWNPDAEAAPVGIYKGEDEGGQPLYFVYMRNTQGRAFKMDCP